MLAIAWQGGHAMLRSGTAVSCCVLLPAPILHPPVQRYALVQHGCTFNSGVHLGTLHEKLALVAAKSLQAWPLTSAHESFKSHCK